jgi:hypothetical protein
MLRVMRAARYRESGLVLSPHCGHCLELVAGSRWNGRRAFSSQPSRVDAALTKPSPARTQPTRYQSVVSLMSAACFIVPTKRCTWPRSRRSAGGFRGADRLCEQRVHLAAEGGLSGSAPARRCRLVVTSDTVG